MVSFRFRGTVVFLQTPKSVLMRACPLKWAENPLPHETVTRGKQLEMMAYNIPLALYRFVYPISDSSTALAASLPSRIAHTTRDWPLCISPAANTRDTDVS